MQQVYNPISGHFDLVNTGTITGGGTTSFLPKFTPSGTILGNSLIFDNGTGIGIGTATPGYKLHVVGTTRFLGSSVFGSPSSDIIANCINLDLAYKIAFDGIHALSYDLVNDAIRVSGGAVGGRIIFTNSGSTEVARFDTGALGIGTNAPSGLLDVNGTVYLRTNTFVDTLASVAFGTGSQIAFGSGQYFQSRGEIGSAYTSFRFDTANQVTFAGAKIASWSNNGVEYFSINKDGNLTAPVAQVGNAGLVSGDLYFDTAANALANGDLILIRKT